MGGGELGNTTQLYVDMHVCTEILHVPYSTYLRNFSGKDKAMIESYLMVKGRKMEAEIEKSKGIKERKLSEFSDVPKTQPWKGK